MTQFSKCNPLNLGGCSTPQPVKAPVLLYQVETAQRYVTEAHGAADRIEHALDRLSGSGPKDSNGGVRDTPETFAARMFDLNESLASLVARLSLLGNRLDEII